MSIVVAVMALAVGGRRLKVFRHPTLRWKNAILSGLLMAVGPVLVALPVPWALPLSQGGAHSAGLGVACFAMGLFWPSVATDANVTARERRLFLSLFLVGAALMISGFVSRAFFDLAPIHAGVTQLGDALSLVGFIVATGTVACMSRDDRFVF